MFKIKLKKQSKKIEKGSRRKREFEAKRQREE